MPRIDVDEDLDKRVEEVLPDYYGGERKSSIRTNFILSEWLAGRGRPTSNDAPAAPAAPASTPCPAAEAGA